MSNQRRFSDQPNAFCICSRESQCAANRILCFRASSSGCSARMRASASEWAKAVRATIRAILSATGMRRYASSSRSYDLARVTGRHFESTACAEATSYFAPGPRRCNKPCKSTTAAAARSIDTRSSAPWMRSKSLGSKTIGRNP